LLLIGWLAFFWNLGTGLIDETDTVCPPNDGYRRLHRFFNGETHFDKPLDLLVDSDRPLSSVNESAVRLLQQAMALS